MPSGRRDFAPNYDWRSDYRYRRWQYRIWRPAKMEIPLGRDLVERSFVVADANSEVFAIAALPDGTLPSDWVRTAHPLLLGNGTPSCIALPCADRYCMLNLHEKRTG